VHNVEDMNEATVSEHTAHHSNGEPGTTPGSSTWGSPPPPAPPRAEVSADEARNWGVAAHLSGFLAAYVALGFLGPLVVMLTGGQRSAFVRRHAVEALNFNLSVLLWVAISALLVVVLIGIPMLIGIGIVYLVASIMGALAASRGEEYRYPLTLRFVR
jgi:hypothetical protein